MASLTDGTTTIPQATTAFVQTVGAAPLSGNASYAAPNAAPAAKTTPSALSSEAGAAALAASATKAAALTPLPSLPSNLTAAQFQAITGNAPATPLSQAQLNSKNTTPVGGPQPGGSYDTNGNYTPPAAASTAPSTTATTGSTTATPTTVTLVNPDTGQEYTLNNPTADQISSFKDQGFSIAEGSGDGTGIIDTSTDPAIQAQQAATDKAKADVAAATAKLTSFNVSNDPVLQAQLASITAQWNTREAAMTNYNSSQVAATTALGYRSGMQYSGGAGGAFGGIITAEEQEGVSRIGDLEAQKQQALSAATTAYSNQEWDQYSKLVDVAEQAYHDQVDQLNKLQTNAYQATKDAQDEQDKQQEDYYNQVTKPIQDMVQEAAKNSAPPDVLAQIQSATDVGSALTAAGQYLKTPLDPTSLAGEYQAAVSAGYKGLPGDWVAAQKYKEAYSAAAASQQAAADYTDSSAGQSKLFQQGVATLKSELSNRSGGLGLQDAKVNQAIHLKALFDQYATTKTVPIYYSDGLPSGQTQTETIYNIPNSQYTELAMGLASLISPTNTVAEGTINKITQATAAGDINEALTYATGEPQNGSTQAVFQNLKDSVDRQGTVAEAERETYVNDLLERLPPGLSADNLETLTESAGLNSYTDPSPANMTPAQIDANAYSKIQTFAADPKNATVLSQIHAQYPDASNTDIAQELGLIPSINQ